MATKKLVQNTRQQTIEKQDGWANIATNLGVAGKDKRLASKPTSQAFTREQSDRLYRADDIARRVVTKLPQESFREGYNIVGANAEQDTLVSWLGEQFERLKIDDMFRKASQWARLYGGSAVLLGIDDGLPMSEPLSGFNVKRVSWSAVLDRWQLTYQDVQKDITMPEFGLPQKYRISTLHGIGFADGQSTIHRSRMVIFDGHELPDVEYIKNAYWHQSVLEAIYIPLLNFNGAHDSSASIIQDFAQAVFKIKNLTEILSMERGDELVTKRLALIDRTRSIVNALVLEDGEDFLRQTTSVAGLSELVATVSDRLVAATEMPHNLIMGDGAKGGLGSEGTTENRDWYDTVAAHQQNYLKPKLKRVLDLLMLSKESPTRGVIDNDIDIVFKPLWQLDQKDEVAMRYQQAQIDQIYLSTGVIDPEEIAQSRFGGAEYSIETQMLSDRQTLNESTQKSDGFYQSIDFTLPIEVRNEMVLGVAQTGRYYPENINAPSVNLARDLCNGVTVSPLQAKMILSFFETNPTPAKSTEDVQSAALVNWKLNGGTWGQIWVQKLCLQMEAEDQRGNI